MASPAADRLTAAHRRELSAISAAVSSGVFSLALGADPFAIDLWYSAAFDGLLTKVMAGHSQARRSSTEYLTRHAALSGRTVRPVPASLNLDQVRTSLRVTGPVAFKRAIDNGAEPNAAVETMARQLAGSSSRLALAGDRDTFEQTLASPRGGIVGYRRRLGGRGCGFCAMLASRGAVYVSERSALVAKDGHRYHDHCRCTPEPLYAHEDEPAEVLELQRQWKRVTAGHSNAAARQAWEDHWEGKLPPGQIRAAADLDPARFGLAATMPGPTVGPVSPPFPVAVRPVLAQARSIRQVQRAFSREARRLTGRDVPATFEGQAVDIAVEHAEGALRVLEQFPDIEVSLHTARAVGHENSYAVAQPHMQRVGFNPLYAADSARYRESLARAGGARFHLRGETTPVGTGAHELAHVVHHQYDPVELRRAVSRLIDDLAAEAGLDIVSYVRREIGEYALKHIDEMIAASVADALTSGAAASRLSQGVLRLMKERYAAGRKLGGEAVRATEPLDLNRLTVRQLRDLAAARGIPIPPGSRKAEIVRLIDEAPTTPPGMPALSNFDQRIPVFLDSGFLSRVRGLDHLPEARRTQIAESIDAYGGDAYEEVRAYLQDGADGLTALAARRAARGFTGRSRSLAETKRIVDDLDEAMAASRLTDNIEVWRGFRTGKTVFGDDLDSSASLVGREFSDSSFASASLNREYAEGFAADGVLMRVRVPRGAHAIGVTDARGEAELLLDRGWTFRVVADHGPADLTSETLRGLGRKPVKRLLDVEAIPPSGVRTLSRADVDAYIRRTEPGLTGQQRHALEELNAAETRAYWTARAAGEPHDRALMTPRERAVKDRQAELDRVSATARVLADMEEMIQSRASLEAMRHTLDTLVRGIDEADAAALTRALAGPRGATALKREMAKIERRTGLIRQGRAGERVTFDRRLHNDLGADLPAGTQVEILRPAYGYRIPGDQADIQIGKAAVIRADASPTAVRRGGPITSTRAAVTRQAAIDKARAVGDALAELAELIANQAPSLGARLTRIDPAVLLSRLDNRAARGLPDAVRLKLRKAIETGDVAEIQAAVTSAARAAKVEISGEAGVLARMDRKAMQPIAGSTIRDGADVIVVRPGYTATIGREKVQISKAVVEEATPEDVRAFARRAQREAARERNRQLERAGGTARLLAEVDQLLARNADTAAIRARLDPALIAREQIFGGADPAVREALAAVAGDPAKLRAAVTRLSTRSKLKPVSRSGAKVKYDPELMEPLPGVDIKPGAQVTVVTRGASVTLPDGSVVQLQKAVVTPIRKPDIVERATNLEQILAEMDSLAGAGADRRALERLLDGVEGVDKATLDILRVGVINMSSVDRAEALRSLRGALTRAGRKLKIKPTGVAGERVKFDPATMDGPPGVEIPKGRSVIVVRRGATVTRPDGSTVVISRPQVEVVRRGGMTGPTLDEIPMGRATRKEWDALPGDEHSLMMDRQRRALAPIVEGQTYGTKGLTVRLERGYILDDRGYLSGTIYDANGLPVGQFRRSFDKVRSGTFEVNHDLLQLDRSVQGSGFAEEFNQNLFDWYRRNGFESVHVHANIDVGGYTWATKGFDFEDKSVASQFISTAIGKVGKALKSAELSGKLPRGLTRADLEALRDYLLDIDTGRIPARAYDISQFGRKPGQGGKSATWAGKWLMLGSHWTGKLML